MLNKEIQDEARRRMEGGAMDSGDEWVRDLLTIAMLEVFAVAVICVYFNSTHLPHNQVDHSDLEDSDE